MIAAVVRQRVEELDLTRLGHAEYEPRLKAAQRRFLQLRLHLGGQIGTGELGPGLLVLFEGKDAGGKGGALKRLVEPLDPRHYRVSSLRGADAGRKAPPLPLALLPGLPAWAAWPPSIAAGTAACWSSASRAATLEQWSRAYDEIVQFERTLVLEGLILVKLWLHISDKEQMSRFRSRERDPLRRWKLTDEDWRNREKAREYERAADEMFDRTDHGLGPWDLIPAENKRFARVRSSRR